MMFNLTKWLSDRDVFKCLVSKGFRIMDDLDEEERTKILEEIFKKDDPEFMQDLLKNGLNFGDTENLLTHVIELMPCDHDNVGIVRCLVENGCSVNAPEPVNQSSDDDEEMDEEEPPSPLSEAISHMHLNIIAYLLKQGAIPREQDLITVGMSLHAELIDVFIKADIDLNAEGAAILRGALEIPDELHVEDSAPHWIETVTTLLNAGANPNSASCIGSTCGHHFVKQLSNNTTVWSEEFEQIFDLLMKHGLNLNAADILNGTVLHCCNWTNLNLLEMLLKNGADPNARDIKAGTVAALKVRQIIHWKRLPRMSKFNKIIDILVKYNADLTVAGVNHNTILTSLLDVEHRGYVHMQIKRLFQVAEIDLLNNEKVNRLLEDDTGHPAIPLMQGGCNYPRLLDRLAMIAATRPQLVVEGFDFNGFASCVDPSYDFKKELDLAVRYKDSNFIPSHNMDDFDGPLNTSLADPPKLCYLTVYHIRNQILKANGNRSIIPRAGKLPLPQCMIEMVTLECYKMADEGRSHPYLDSSDDEF